MDDLEIEADTTLTSRDADLLNLLALFLTCIGFALSCIGVPLVLAVPVGATVWYTHRHASRDGRTLGTITLVSLFMSLGGWVIVLFVALTMWSLPLAAIGALSKP